jgi:hypothetical protein
MHVPLRKNRFVFLIFPDDVTRNPDGGVTCSNAVWRIVPDSIVFLSTGTDGQVLFKHVPESSGR